jgi:hypothetical protein
MSKTVDVVLNLFSDGICKFAKKHNVTSPDIQLMMFLKDEKLKYAVYSKNKETNKTEFKEYFELSKMMPLWASMLPNINNLCNKYIFGFFEKVEKDTNVNKNKIQFIVYATDEKAKDLKAYMYENGKPVKEISLEYIMSDNK